MPDFKVTIKGRLVDQVSLNSSEIKIGRGSDNDLVLPNQSVSRKHALISPIGGQQYISAFSSENPVFVNGQECKQVVKLEENDKIQVGKYLITVSNLVQPKSVFEDEALTHMLSREHLENYAQDQPDTPIPAQPAQRNQAPQVLTQQLKMYQVLLTLSVILNLYLISQL